MTEIDESKLIRLNTAINRMFDRLAALDQIHRHGRRDEMTEIEPTIDNVREGDVVTLEEGAPDEPGHRAFTTRITGEFETVAHTRSLGWLRGRARREGWRVTRIRRPDPSIPTTPGTRFWATFETKAREYIATDQDTFVSLIDGMQWDCDKFPGTVVPAPEPETVPLPVDLIREAEEWLSNTGTRTALDVLRRIVRSVREREVEL